jgi:hypothetical protein
MQVVAIIAAASAAIVVRMDIVELLWRRACQPKVVRLCAVPT